MSGSPDGFSASRSELDQPLPGMRIAGDRPRFYEYTRFPPFSRYWLIGRTLIAGSILLAFSVLILMSNAVLLNDIGTALIVSTLFFVGFFSFCTLGPALATWVRYRQWPLRRERWLVVAMLALGILGSASIDSLVSSDIKARVEQKLKESEFLDQRSIDRGKQIEKNPQVLATGLIIAGLIYGLLGGLLALLAYLREPAQRAAILRERALAAARTERQQGEMRLQHLQAQIEPHFLFNTLAAVRASLRDDPAQAEQIIDALIDYLRATIPKLRADAASARSTVEDQLALCERYLALMRLRMGERMSFSISVEAGVRSAELPPLLALTLVENAIKHGIEPKPGPVSVHIRAERVGDVLCLAVLDDGVGLRTGIGGGLGLANVREHLRTRYGEQARLDLQSRAEGGTVAQITLPLELTG